MGNSSSSHGKLHRLQYNGAANSRDHLSSSSSSERFTSGPPSAPGKPYLVVADPADEPDVITVKWKPPARDCGSKITGYIVEHRRTISPHWVKATPGKVQHNQLTLSGLEPGWRYQFRVKAINASGQSPPSIVSDPVTMTAHRMAVVAPVFVCGIEDRVALENDQVKFEVEFEGTPAPKISWFKDGFELFSNRRQRVNTDNGMSTLYIHQAEYSDEGEIKCSATNRAGHAITKARLRLEAPPMVRLPQDYEEGLLLEQNEPMRLKVSVSGRPLPQVTWLHDGEEIRGADRFEVIHTDKYAALKLACVKRSDRGCYQIQAVNPLGEHMASFLVTVTDRPSQPGKVHVSKTSGKSVTLSWKPPEDDGGCKIGNYIIEYNRVGWDMWLKASTSRQLTADLDDLLEGSEYRFRVKAENPYGMSLPSDVSEPIFLPDIKRGIYKPVITPALLFEDEEKLIQIQETEMLEYFGRKSKSPEPLSKARKLSVDEVSPPVPKRRKKKSKTDLNNSDTDIYKSFSYLDISTETWQQPIEQKDHWGLPPGLKTNNGQGDTTNSQIPPMNYKTKRNSTDSLLLLNFERGSAPPISLSSPELGAEAEGFEEHLRNSYSSSELLYERNLNRFNGYSNNENLSSEAQKIAIYAMDRKNSLRRSPITRRSNDDSEEKSIFSDSDSVHSVVDISKKNTANSFMSLANSIEEEIMDDAKETIEDDNTEQSTSFSGIESETSIESDDDYNMSDRSEEKFTNFGSGKRALEHNTSSAFFSTVYYDDDYLSDQKLSDRERSKSPAKWVEKADGGALTSASIGSENPDRSPSTTMVISPSMEETSEKSDSMSQDSLNYSYGSTDSGEYSRPDEKKSDTADISTVEIPVDGIYRPRDGIPKYVMLPNPFFKENAAVTESSEQVKFKLSSDSIGIVPPEIPERETGVGSGVRSTLPVITVTETSDRSPKSVLKKIFVPPFFSRQSNGPGRDKYDDQVTRNKSLRREPKISLAVSNRGDAIEPLVITADTCTDDNANSSTDVDATAAAEMIAVRHYGDIVEQYSGVARRPVAKTYLDFEELKMAAAIECSDEPVVKFEAGLRNDYEEDGNVDEEYGDEEYYDESGEFSTTLSVQPEADVNLATSGEWLSAVVLHQPEMPEPNTVPYLKIFGNLSLAVFGYWLYMCKDEKLSVPVFGFLLFRFFKTQVWDRI